MNMKISLTTEGKVKFSTGSDRVRLEDIKKWLGRNRDAILVKLEDHPDDWIKYKVGHLCRIEEGDDGQTYNVFVGPHYIGQLPNEAIVYANQVELSPEFLISIIGRIEYNPNTERDDISIYIA